MSTAIPPRNTRVAEMRENRRKIERSNAERKAYLEESEKDLARLRREVQRSSPSLWVKRLASKL